MCAEINPMCTESGRLRTEICSVCTEIGPECAEILIYLSGDRGRSWGIAIIDTRPGKCNDSELDNGLELAPRSPRGVGSAPLFALIPNPATENIGGRPQTDWNSLPEALEG